MKIVQLIGGALALALGASAGQASAGTLTTDFSTSNSGRSGLYFDLTGIHTITIQDFVVNGEAGDWSVWYKAGAYAGSETNPAAWTLMGSGSTSSFIDTLHVGGLTIGAGQTFGIYVFDFGGGGNAGAQNYHDGVDTYSNADLTFVGGVANYGNYYGLGPFSNTLANRVWSGAIDYTVSGGVPEPQAWALMILGLGAVGAAMRRRSAVAA